MTQQDPAAQKNQKTPTIDEYQPKSTLVTPEHKIQRAKYPFIDIHSHHWNPTAAEVDDLIKGMDSINLRVMVNLSGGTGEELKKTVQVMKGRYPDRFVVFANMSYDDLNTPGFGKRVAARLEEDVRKELMSELRERWERETNGHCVFVSATERRNIDELRRTILDKVRELYRIRYPYKSEFLY